MASSKNNVRLGGFRPYFGTEYLGQCSQDGVTISRNGNKVDVKSALNGESIFTSFASGETVEISLELLEFDKYVLGLILGTVTTFGTNTNNALLGKITAGSSAGLVIPSKPLLIYPTYVDSNNVPYTADINNQFCFGLVQAVPSLENEFMISPTEETRFSITFTGQVDTTRPEGQQVWFIGAVTAPSNSVPVISA